MSVSPPRETHASRTLRISSAEIMSVLVMLAALLDATQPMGAGVLAPLWLDGVAVVCLVWALWHARTRNWRAWATPFDGRILAALAIGVLQALPPRASGDGTAGLRQMVACGVCFYALHAGLRGRSRFADLQWRTFALACLLFGVHALLAATSGLAALQADAAKVDAAWSAHHGLAKAMVFVTVLTLGRAAESGSSPAWRVTALIGVLGCLLHAAAGGFGLDPAALGRLDEPLYFSATSVLLLVLFGLVRNAWEIRRACPPEAWRWRAMAGGFTLLALFGLFGETMGGEGVRVLALLAAVTVLAAAPRPADAGAFAPGDEAEEPLARAA